MTTMHAIPTPDDLNAYSPEQYERYEAQLRRLAHRHDLRLVKNRGRDPRAVEHGTYMLVDLMTNAVVAKGFAGGWGLHLDDVHRELGTE